MSIFKEDPTALAKRIVAAMDKDEWETPPAHERPGDYRREEAAVEYAIRWMRAHA